MRPGPALTLQGDPDQLEQVLINLVRNAADAALETGGGVRLGWQRKGAGVEVWVEDDGPGLANTGNLFVPFFTTKPGGSGIGLVLSRQIAEGHGGTLALENRAGRARLRGAPAPALLVLAESPAQHRVHGPHNHHQRYKQVRRDPRRQRNAPPQLPRQETPS